MVPNICAVHRGRRRSSSQGPVELLGLSSSLGLEVNPRQQAAPRRRLSWARADWEAKEWERRRERERETWAGSKGAREHEKQKDGSNEALGKTGKLRDIERWGNREREPGNVRSLSRIRFTLGGREKGAGGR